MAQQNANHPMPMRQQQFVGGPQMGNMMGAQQGMVSPQSYNMGGAGPSAGPAMQQQNQQMGVQMQQQVKVGPRVSPQNQQQMPPSSGGQAVQPSGNPMPNSANTVAVAAPSQDPNQSGAAAPVPKQEINTAALCRYGLEVVQEIVSRMTEVFTLLKTLQPPNGTPQGANMCNERKIKIQELLAHIRGNFKKLGMIYQRCNENAQLQGMEFMHIESLIPLKEEWDQKADERKMSESYRTACEERREIMEQVLLKNKHLKEVIDSMRRLIWEINSMLCMRRS